MDAGFCRPAGQTAVVTSSGGENAMLAQLMEAPRKHKGPPSPVRAAAAAAAAPTNTAIAGGRGKQVAAAAEAASSFTTPTTDSAMASENCPVLQQLL